MGLGLALFNSNGLLILKTYEGFTASLMSLYMIRTRELEINDVIHHYVYSSSCKLLGAKLLYNWLCLSVCTPLALLYMEIVYIIHNDSLLFLGNEPSPPFAPMDEDRPCFYIKMSCSPVIIVYIDSGGNRPLPKKQLSVQFHSVDLSTNYRGILLFWSFCL